MVSLSDVFGWGKALAGFVSQVRAQLSAPAIGQEEQNPNMTPGMNQDILQPIKQAPAPFTPVVSAPSVAVKLDTKPDILQPIKQAPAAPGSGAWTVQEMCDEIARNEGGFIDDPQDAGGATKYGISLRFLQSVKWGQQGGRNAATVDTVSHLLLAEAQSIYVNYFYKPAHLDQLPNCVNIVMQLFDIAVNTGVNTGNGKAEAIKILQHALGAPVDGELGPATLKTLDAVMTMKGASFVNDAIVDARINFYKEVVANHPVDAKFLKGWEARANKYRVKE